MLSSIVHLRAWQEERGRCYIEASFLSEYRNNLFSFQCNAIIFKLDSFFWFIWWYAFQYSNSKYRLERSKKTRNDTHNAVLNCILLDAEVDNILGLHIKLYTKTNYMWKVFSEMISLFISLKSIKYWIFTKHTKNVKHSDTAINLRSNTKILKLSNSWGEGKFISKL